MNIIEYNKALAEVFQRLVFGNTTKYAWQVKFPDSKDPDYLPPFCPTCRRSIRCEHMPYLTMDHLRQHFDQKPVVVGNRTYSGISCCGLFAGNRTKWFCADMDSPSACQVMRTNFLPVLDKHRIDWLWEHSGTTDYEKGHLFILLDCTLPAQRSLISLLLDEAKLSDWQELKRKYTHFKIEFYPYQYDQNMIRFPGSVHLRTGRVNDCTFKGVRGNSAAFIVKALSSMNVLDQDRVANIILALKPEYEKKLAKEREQKTMLTKVVARGGSGEFAYVPINLPLPTIDAEVVYPKAIKKIFGNCQAMNKLWDMTVNDGYLGRSGDDTVHKWGLMLDSLALYDELTTGKDMMKYTIAGNFIDYVFDEFRPGGFEGHNWQSYKEKFTSSPAGLVSGCDKMERIYGLCSGCQFKNNPLLRSPEQFVSGKTIVKSLIKPINAVSNEYLRQVEFPKMQSDVVSYLASTFKYDMPSKDIVLAYHQGAGKSQCSDELVSILSKANLSTLLAVPDANLALQHKQNIEALGQKCYVVFSHEKLFSEDVKKEMGITFDCPHELDITRTLKIFPDSTSVKNTYCKKCPFANKCPYPTQYADVAKTKSNVVIMQHAHFAAKPALIKILRKHFHTMVVDETFTNSCFFSYKASDADMVILEFLARNYPWTRGLYDWVRNGGYPKDKIEINQADLESIYEMFDQLKIDYCIPELLYAHRDYMYYDPLFGVEKFTPIPRSTAKLRIFTDATAPVEYMQVLLNNDKVQVTGQEYMLNPKLYHPLNEYHQSLDGSTSVQQMNERGYLQFLLDHACKDMESAPMNELGLVTVYKNQVEEARQYIRSEYSHIEDRIIVSHMEKGTNAYANRHRQYIMACRYPNAQDLAREAWRVALMHNYWVGTSGHCLGDPDRAEMAYWDKVGPGGNYQKDRLPVKRRELVDGRAYEVQYYNMFRTEPTNKLYKIASKMYRSVKQQANRMRYVPGERRDVWDYDKTETDLLVTDSFLISSI